MKIREGQKLWNRAGIYGIHCIPADMWYIGSTIDLSRRKGQHMNKLTNGRAVNKSLQDYYDVYGDDNFEFVVLEYTEKNKEYLLFTEKEYISQYADKCMNFANSPNVRHPPWTINNRVKIRVGQSRNTNPSSSFECVKEWEYWYKKQEKVLTIRDADMIDDMYAPIDIYDLNMFYHKFDN